MDLNPSPERSPPDHELHSQRDSRSPPSQMATMVIAQAQVHNMPGPLAGVNKRYRPAPAKTFQCRGYGECRMVFSRSEHLARHIRKHTGERPFSCHCGKQFSRLDNLRQHAQTVHADKQDQNERMMRDLTSLHATMAAANKAGNSRGGRRPAANNGNQQQGNASPSSPTGDGESLNLIKQEDLGAIPMHQRPGTTTGYEGEHLIYHQQQQHHQTSWHVQDSMDSHRPTPRSAGPTHSFRDPGQSFLAPSSSSQSFLSYNGPLTFLPDPAPPQQRPRSSSSRPPTASGPPSNDPARSLPPLSSVVPASLTPPFPAPVLSFPRRPSTANRPGTAPPYFANGLAVSVPGRELGGQQQYDDGSPSSSPSAGNDPSPFYFHPPPPPADNPRKRGFGAPDGPAQQQGEYEYGSESRPQSRRLSVMELCNDNAASEFLLSQRVPSRPSTSSGLVSSASALHIFDRPGRGSHSPGAGASPTLLARAAHAAAKADGGAQQQQQQVQQQRVPSSVLSRGGGGEGWSPTPAFSTPSPTSSAGSALASPVAARPDVYGQQQQYASPPPAAVVEGGEYGFAGREFGLAPGREFGLPGRGYELPGRGYELPGREVQLSGRYELSGREFQLPGRGYELPGRGGYAGEFDFAGRGYQHGYPGFEYEYDGFEFDQAGQVRGGVGAYASVAFGMRV